MENHAAASVLQLLLEGLVTDETPAEVARAVAALHAAFRADTLNTDPFLSVIMRTQGTRVGPLRDALNSLASQSVDDFEVILVVHSASTLAGERVGEVLAQQPDSLVNRIRTLSLTSGGRSAPLNAGLEQARGRYVAVFDDDDLVLEEWVSAFAESESAARGRLMRARVGTQDVSVEAAQAGDTARVSGSEVRDEYPADFDLFRHFDVNASPFMGWAFPRALFARMGVKFDEDLDLCEDWDVVLRGATLLGVHEIDRMTAVYRRWSTADSSVVTRAPSAWAQSERIVIERLDSSPLLLDAGSVSRIKALMADSDALHAIKTTRSWRLAEAIRRVADATRRMLPWLRRRGE